MDELCVLVVSNDPLARAGLAALLAQAGCTIAGQMAANEELSAQFSLHQPDAALWDLGWEPTPDLEANLDSMLDLIEAGLPVVALLSDVTSATEVWTAGVSGLLTRTTGTESLVVSLEAVAKGLLVLEPTLVAGIFPSRDLSAEPKVEDLTPRELEVLQLLSSGQTNKAIAQQLGISEHTVKFHMNAILGKLGAQSRTEAVVRATRLGLLFL